MSAVKPIDCAAYKFGCSCASQCRIETRRKEDEAKLRRIIAKRNADNVLMTFAVSMMIAALVASSCIFFAIPESQRLARANQENISHVVSR